MKNATHLILVELWQLSLHPSANLSVTFNGSNCMVTVMAFDCGGKVLLPMKQAAWDNDEQPEKLLALIQFVRDYVSCLL